MALTRRVALLTAVSSLGAVLLLGRLATPGSAQSGAGAVTGRVVWCVSLGYPFPLSPDGSTGAPSAEAGAPSTVAPPPEVPAPGIAGDTTSRPSPIRPPAGPLPAGAVLVAAQGSQSSARTDENGRFRLEGVPAGAYLTIAAGPVAAGGGAFALRPNTSVSAGQALDIGTLTLTAPNGGGCQAVRVPPYAVAPGSAEGADPQP